MQSSIIRTWNCKFQSAWPMLIPEVTMNDPFFPWVVLTNEPLHDALQSWNETEHAEVLKRLSFHRQISEPCNCTALQTLWSFYKTCLKISNWATSFGVLQVPRKSYRRSYKAHLIRQDGLTEIWTLNLVIRTQVLRIHISEYINAI